MKKAYPLIFMLLAAGCARDEVNPGGVSDLRTIHLEATTTRAAAATIGDVEGGFRVFAAAGDISSTRDWYPDIDGTNNHLYTDGQWDFQTPVPWPIEASKYPMSFYAWYPADLNSTNGFSLTANPAATDTELFAEITVGSTAADQTDLLAGKSIAAARPASGNLTMTFEHILSKIDFGIIAGRGVTPEILGLGLGYVGDTRTYDFIAGDWTVTQPSLSNGIMYDYYGTLFNAPGTAVPWSPGTGNDETTGVPFYNAATTPSAAEAHLMLMPQTNPVWDPVMGGWFGPGSGTFVGVYYRMTNANGEDEVGYASARSHPDFVEGGYEGPLYVLAAFPLPADASGNFTWESGKGYTYNIGLGTPGSSNGYLGDYYYFDEEGNYIFLPVTGGIEPGEPINDGVIHVTLDVDNWGDEDGGELPEPVNPDPVFVAPEAPYIIYWDDATQTMQLGSWNAVTGGAVTTENQLFFQFGGTVGFLNQNDPWDASDIKFNVTSTTDYASLPDWSDYTGTKSTTDGYLSTADYHNAANVAAGRGDPCMLVGLTVEQVKAGIIDNKRFRMATLTANGGVSDWTVYGTRPASGTLNTTYGVMSSAGTFLPGSSSRTSSGVPYQVGRSVFFWNSQANDDTSARILDVNPTINVSGVTDSRNGIPVRCVGRNSYSISWIDTSDYNNTSSVKITSDVAGTIPITEAVEGQSVTFTAIPTDASLGFSHWNWSSDDGHYDNTSSKTLRNPLTIAMPPGNIWLEVYFDQTATSFGEVIPHDANGRNGALWASEDLSNVGVFNAATTTLFQWGRDVAWYSNYVYGDPVDPNYPHTPGADLTGAATWPEASDPCPDGWRVPTVGEWQRFLDMTTDPLNGSIRQFKPLGSNFSIMLYADGYIDSDGVGTNPFLGAYYWASDSNPGDGGRASYFYWNGTNPAALADDAVKTRAFHVRCVQDIPPTPNPVGEVAIPSADGTYTTVWAGSNLSDKGVFATSATDGGVLFQWGRDVAYTWSGSNVPNWPASDTDQTGNATWPAATDPCPFGWHVPTYGEWQRFHDVMTDPETSGDRTFTSSYGNVTLPVNNYLTNGGTTSSDPSLRANYWIGEQSSAQWAYIFEWVETSNMGSSGYQKTGAFSVRCVRTL